MKKKLFVTLLVTLLITLVTTLFYTFTSVNAEENINVILNDETVTFDTAPVMENDRILVPIRAIAEKMEFDVNWDQKTQTVTLENFSNILTIGINNKYISKTFKFLTDEDEAYQKTFDIPIDVPAKVINDRTYLPLRAVTEAFGCEVEWNQNSQTAEIFYGHTYGEEISFEDEGIEYLAKIELLFNELKNSPNYEPYTYHYTTNFGDNFWMTRSNIYDLITLSPIYNKIDTLKIHEGDLKNIEYLGMNYINDEVDNKTFTLEDFKKFPNLRGIFISGNITDITPLSYIKEWDYLRIDLLNENWCIPSVFNYDVLSQLKLSDAGILLCSRQNWDCYDFIWDANLDPNCDTENSKISYKNYLERFFTTYKVLEKFINENINENMTRTQKIIAINDWICDNITYDYNEDYFESHYDRSIGEGSGEYEIECAVIHHYGQCEDYANLFHILCSMADIPCTNVVGSSYGTSDGTTYSLGNHEWNAVLLEDGEIYYVDTTWNDSNSNKYLLLTEEELREKDTHRWNKEPKFESN